MKHLSMLLFCIILVISSCESKSGTKANMPVRIVLDKHIDTAVIYRRFRVHTIGSQTHRNVYFWSTDLPYEVGDTVTTMYGRLLQ